MYTAIISYDRRAVFHILKPTTSETLRTHCNGLYTESKKILRWHWHKQFIAQLLICILCFVLKRQNSKMRLLALLNMGRTAITIKITVTHTSCCIIWKHQKLSLVFIIKRGVWKKSKFRNQFSEDLTGNWKWMGKLIFHAFTRITKWLGLEETFKGRLAQPLCNEGGHLQLDQIAHTPLSLAYNISRDGGIHNFPG